MDLYFVCTGDKTEIEALRVVKPSHILISFAYFRNKNLSEFINSLGYKPTIMLDSGAFTFKNKGIGKEYFQNFLSSWKSYYINSLTQEWGFYNRESTKDQSCASAFKDFEHDFINCGGVYYTIFSNFKYIEDDLKCEFFLEYLKYIEGNHELINQYVAMDIINEPELTFEYYNLMNNAGYEPIPVYHFGSPMSYLQKYIDDKPSVIGLGGTVAIKDKRRVANWVNSIMQSFPNQRFHLFGSTSKTIISSCPGLCSVDSSTWIMGAINGRPNHIESKKERAIYNLNETLRLPNKYNHTYRQLNFNLEQICS